MFVYILYKKKKEINSEFNRRYLFSDQKKKKFVFPITRKRKKNGGRRICVVASHASVKARNILLRWLFSAASVDRFLYCSAHYPCIIAA
jgi:hypothetical protein